MEHHLKVLAGDEFVQIQGQGAESVYTLADGVLARIRALCEPMG